MDNARCTWNRAPGCFVKTAQLDNVGVVASQWRPRSALCEQIKGTFGRRQVRSLRRKIQMHPANDIAFKLTVIKSRVALKRNYLNQYDLFTPFSSLRPPLMEMSRIKGHSVLAKCSANRSGGDLKICIRKGIAEVL